MDPVDPPSGAFRPAPVVAGSWRRPAAFISVVAALIVAAAVMTRANEPGRVTAPSRAADASPQVAAGHPRLLPPTIACHGLDRAACLEAIATALRSLPTDAPEATAASAWRSLLCDSSIDCPPLDLALAIPRGSVVIDFVDGGPSAWLNVVDRPTPSGASVTDAWIVRWQQAIAPTASPASPTGSGAPASPVAASGASTDEPADRASGQGTPA